MLAYQSGSTPGHELIDEPYLVKCVYVRYGSRLCENAAVAAQRKVGAGAGLCFGVRDRRTIQARIASINDCGPSMASTRFRL